MTSLTLMGVWVRLGNRPVLRGVELRVERPQYLVVLGPSGSGKTTLLRTVAGFVEPEKGRVLVSGRDVTGLPPWERGVAMVQQMPGLLPHLTVLDNVALPAVHRRGLSWGEARSLAARLLEDVGLGGLGARRPGELSGGQLQRAAIAAALAAGAEVLLLDEPLSHLDRLIAERLRGLLRRLRDEHGRLVVHVTHDIDEALALGDEVAVLHAGRIVVHGAVAEVYRCPGSREAAELLGHAVVDGKLLGLPQGLYSVAPDAVRLRRGTGDWLVTRVERERGRARVTLRRGDAVLYAYTPPWGAPRPGEKAEPLLTGEPCPLA